jgi:hypothetical protein
VPIEGGDSVLASGVGIDIDVSHHYLLGESGTDQRRRAGNGEHEQTDECYEALAWTHPAISFSIPEGCQALIDYRCLLLPG